MASRDAGPGSSLLRRVPAIALLVIAFACLGAVFSIANPLFEAPDELQHFFYVVHLAEGRGLPRVDPAAPGLWEQEGTQPPLYYALAAVLVAPLDTAGAESLVWLNEHAYLGDPLRPGNKNRVVHTDAEAWPYRGAVLAVHVARWLSVVLGAATVGLVYRAGRALLPGPGLRAVALGAAALTALTPQFIFINSAVTNDVLVTLLATAAAWLVIAGLRGAGPRRWQPWLGVVLGLAALTKLSGLVLWPWAAGAVAVVRWRQGRPRQAVGELVAIFGLALVLSGWWYVRNWLVYGDPTGLSAMLSVVGQRPEPLAVRDIGTQFEGLRVSYWALFGWFNVALPVWAYRVLDALAVLAILGLPPALLRLRRSGAHLAWLALPFTWLLLMLVSLARWTSVTPGTQGRLLYPAAWAINLLLALGWRGLASFMASLAVRAGRWRAPLRRVAHAFPLLPLAFLAGWAVIAPAGVIGPAYARPQVIRPDQVPAGLVGTAAPHGEAVRYLGGRLEPTSVRPGENVWATAYWEVLRPVDADYTVFVHLIDADGRSVAEANSWPGMGNYPTRLWQPGTVVVDRHPLHVPGGTPAPGLLTADTGLFVYATGESLPGDGSGERAGPNLMGTLRVLPARAAAVRPANTVEARYGEAIRLEGYDVGPAGPLSPGDRLTVVLYWQPGAAVGEDYKVFVHLRNAEGDNVAGSDGRPAADRWPTWAWEPGHQVQDTRVVTVPGNASPGVYTLWTGLYRASDGARAPLAGQGLRVQDDALYLAEVTVR